METIINSRTKIVEKS